MTEGDSRCSTAPKPTTPTKENTMGDNDTKETEVETTKETTETQTEKASEPATPTESDE